MIYEEYFMVHDGSKPRFESVFKDEAIRQAQRIYKAEGIICSITVIRRTEREKVA